LPYAATRLRQEASPGKAPFVSAPFDRSQIPSGPALPPRFTPDAAASTASRPAFCDDRETPLIRDETAGDMPVIWAGGKQKYFFLWDSTAQITPNLGPVVI
jgi:hypothetical protein